MYCIPVFYAYVLFLNGQAIKGVNIYNVCDLICCLEHAALHVPSFNVHTGCLRKIHSDEKKNSITDSSTVWQNVIFCEN